jgi:hypothetical protein
MSLAGSDPIHEIARYRAGRKMTGIALGFKPWPVPRRFLRGESDLSVACGANEPTTSG